MRALLSMLSAVMALAVCAQYTNGRLGEGTGSEQCGVVLYNEIRCNTMR